MFKAANNFDVLDPATGTPLLLCREPNLGAFTKLLRFTDWNQKIGGFKQKFFSIGGAFSVLDANDQKLCDLKGKWTSWEFKFLSQGAELATVTKKWSGLGKELFTSADNYVLQISEEVPPNQPVRQLILAAVLCIDMVLKE